MSPMPWLADGVILDRPYCARPQPGIALCDMQPFRPSHYGCLLWASTGLPYLEKKSCTRRWSLRMAFEAQLVAFLLSRAHCRFRKSPYQRGLLVGAVGIVVLGALLLAGDPGPDRPRGGNSLLLIALLALIVSIAYHILKPRGAMKAQRVSQTRQGTEPAAVQGTGPGRWCDTASGNKDAQTAGRNGAHRPTQRRNQAERGNAAAEKGEGK